MLNTRELDDSNEDSGLMALVCDYVALTKPGIMALLLVTTLGAMLIAASGAPPFGLVLLTMAGGWMSAAGANVLNCVIDRDIDARMPRTRKRGTASGRIPANSALVFGLALTLGGGSPARPPGELAGRIPGVGRQCLLRSCLHPLAQAYDATEHRHRRRRRCCASPGGLVCGDGNAFPRRMDPLRDHLLLDTTAFLGAGAAEAG